MKKRLLLLLILISTLSSLMIVKPVQSSITKLSVPLFTLKLEAHPYDVPPTYAIDPYTGENVTTQSGYHVENKTIEVTIRNQPFTPYIDSENNAVNLHYKVRIKGSFSDTWSELGHIHSSGSAYTQVSYAIGQGAIYPVLMNVPVGGKLDFQVMALAGYYTPVYATLYQIGEDFHGETSGWSNTQTITITATSSTPSPSPEPTSSPSPTSTAEPFPTSLGIAIAVLVTIATLALVVVILSKLLVYYRKK